VSTGGFAEVGLGWGVSTGGFAELGLAGTIDVVITLPTDEALGVGLTTGAFVPLSDPAEVGLPGVMEVVMVASADDLPGPGEATGVSAPLSDPADVGLAGTMEVVTVPPAAVLVPGVGIGTGVSLPGSAGVCAVVGRAGVAALLVDLEEGVKGCVCSFLLLGGLGPRDVVIVVPGAAGVPGTGA
jgi:hypothetical protein